MELMPEGQEEAGSQTCTLCGFVSVCFLPGVPSVTCW